MNAEIRTHRNTFGLNPVWIFSALLIGLIGCGSPRRGQPITGPVPLATPALERGRAAFQAHCHTCHPGGEGGLGPSLNDKPLPAFLIRRQVRWGLGVMPGFDEKEIEQQELEELVSYLLLLRQRG